MDAIYDYINEADEDDLTDIMDAVQARRKDIGQEKFISFKVGDEVRIDAPSLRPKYLNGAVGTITEKRITKITVKFGDLGYSHDPYGKWSDRNCVVSPSMVTKVEA